MLNVKSKNYYLTNDFLKRNGIYTNDILLRLRFSSFRLPKNKFTENKKTFKNNQKVIFSDGSFIKGNIFNISLNKRIKKHYNMF